jgi:hypothetical protein
LELSIADATTRSVDDFLLVFIAALIFAACLCHKREQEHCERSGLGSVLVVSTIGKIVVASMRVNDRTARSHDRSSKSLGSLDV